MVVERNEVQEETTKGPGRPHPEKPQKQTGKVYLL